MQSSPLGANFTLRGKLTSPSVTSSASVQGTLLNSESMQWSATVATKTQGAQLTVKKYLKSTQCDQMGRNFAQLTLIILYIDGFFVKKNVV
jgi:hypothetical protein